MKILEKMRRDSLANPPLLFLVLLTIFWAFLRRWNLVIITLIMTLITWYVTYGSVKNEDG